MANYQEFCDHYCLDSEDEKSRMDYKLYCQNLEIFEKVVERIPENADQKPKDPARLTLVKNR